MHPKMPWFHAAEKLNQAQSMRLPYLWIWCIQTIQFENSRVFLSCPSWLGSSLQSLQQLQVSTEHQHQFWYIIAYMYVYDILNKIEKKILTFKKKKKEISLKEWKKGNR